MDSGLPPQEFNSILERFNWATSSQKWIAEGKAIGASEEPKEFQLGHFFAEMDSVKVAS